MDITTGNTRSHIIRRGVIGIAVRPRPILTHRQTYDPSRTHRYGVAETETLLPDGAGYVYPRRRTGPGIRKDAAGRHDIHQRIGYVRLTDPCRRTQRGLRRTGYG